MSHFKAYVTFTARGLFTQNIFKKWTLFTYLKTLLHTPIPLDLSTYSLERIANEALLRYLSETS